MLGKMSLYLPVIEEIISRTASVIWFFVAAYFCTRFSITTRKSITLALGLMSISCALVELVPWFGIPIFLLHLLLFCTALFVGVSILQVHFTEKR